MQDILIQLKCFDCGHCQEALAMNPQFEDGDVLVEFVAGSDFYYCGRCDQTNLITLGYRRTEASS